MFKSATLSPLSNQSFRLIVTGALLANLGNTIQSVGAAWQLTAGGAHADIVALVQTAMNLPVMLLALPAGAWADMFDRRGVILKAQTGMLVISLVLAAITMMGFATPGVIITLTFLLACGIACFNPALSGSIAGVVPRAELAAAVALNIVGFNLARSLGPAIGGAIVSTGGAAAAYFVNAASYLVAIIVFWRWEGIRAVGVQQRRRVHTVIAEGLRHAFASPEIRTILVRAFTFSASGSAAWALMPLVAADLLHEGSTAYGLLLGALGIGAVIGAATSTEFRRRFSSESIVRMAGLTYGFACIVVALVPHLWGMLVVLVVAGAGWVQALSGFSVAGQLWSPRELVGRITAMVSSLTFGGIAIGSWLWGNVAQTVGVATALIASGALMVALPLLGTVFRMPEHGNP